MIYAVTFSVAKPLPKTIEFIRLEWWRLCILKQEARLDLQGHLNLQGVNGMKLFKKYRSRACLAFSHIKIVDRFLIVIMVILLMQSIYCIFDPADTELMSSIDVVLRTTIAAIFGYFISVNFIKSESKQPDEKPRIPDEENTVNDNVSNLQIYIIGSICIVSIFILIIARNFSGLNTATIPVITQFRDIVCGSIGFFIGVPSANLKK